MSPMACWFFKSSMYIIYTCSVSNSMCQWFFIYLYSSKTRRYPYTQSTLMYIPTTRYSTSIALLTSLMGENNAALEMNVESRETVNCTCIYACLVCVFVFCMFLVDIYTSGRTCVWVACKCCVQVYATFGKTMGLDYGIPRGLRVY